jgi:hypothetical protein
MCWALVRSIEVSEKRTLYSFAHLKKITGHKRSDLRVVSTGKPLPDKFIRSYAIVQTPGFIKARYSNK